MTTSFTGPQSFSILNVFGGTNGADLHGATITARVMVVSAGTATALQMYTQSTAFASDYGGFANLPAVGSFTNITYNVPASTAAYDTTKIRQIYFQIISSTGPADGSAPSETQVLIDSVTITNAPPAPGGGSYAPYTFDTGILPFYDNGIINNVTFAAAGIPDTVSWVP
jgi:hypothetical protein